MKNDIIINYSKISGIRDNIGKYKSALDTMEETLKRIKVLLETENSGESITALLVQYYEVRVYIYTCRRELEDLESLFAGYYHDMTNIIKPKNDSSDTRVDRGDIWYNLQTILSSVQEIGKIQRGASYVTAFQTSTSSEANLQRPSEAGTKAIDEAQIKNQEENYRKLENIKRKIGEVSRRMEDHAEGLNMEFNSRIVPYEDMDDNYKSKAKAIYDRYASFKDKVGIFAINALEVNNSIDEAGSKLLEDTAENIWGALKGTTMYVLGAAAADQEAATGVRVSEENQKYIEAFKKGNDMFKKLLGDPETAVEGMIEGSAQQVSDAYDQKGIAYCLTYGGGSLALGYGGSKLLGAISKMNKIEMLSSGSKFFNKFDSTISKIDNALGSGKIIVDGEKISMSNMLTKGGITKKSVNSIIEKLDTKDLEKVYHYLDKRPNGFNTQEFVDKIAYGKSVDDTIKWAKIEEAHSWGEKEFSNWVDNITPYENKAIKEYASNGSDVNQYLRGDSDTITKEGIRRVYELNKALDKAEIPNDMTVYRGTDVNAVKKYLPMYEELSEDTIKKLVGQKIKDEAFISTSVLKEASFHGKDVSWVINAPKGANGAYIGTISRYGKQELEVLFNAGQEMAVKEAKFTPDGKIEIVVDLIK